MAPRRSRTGVDWHDRGEGAQGLSLLHNAATMEEPKGMPWLHDAAARV